MRKGFIFNFDLCVSCKACSAACILENKWSVPARNIYTFNSEILPDLPVTNLSLACNHCEEPLCLYGCPTGAYSRDETTRAIIINSEKCIGCRYCQWNCPYDAPKLNLGKGHIEKCNFCHTRISEGVEPACTAACPTGALKFGEIPENIAEPTLKWIPEKKISPALRLTGANNRRALRIVPEPVNSENYSELRLPEKKLTGEWSLVFFSFLTIISVSLNIGSLLGGISKGTIVPIAVLLIAALFSVFHLKNKQFAFKAILNAGKSPLSREILLFAVYGLFTAANVLFPGNQLLFLTVVFGFLLLMAIDSVYTYADRSTGLLLHTGQAFLTTLLIGSYLAGELIPFLFVSSIKIILISYNLYAVKLYGIYSTLRIVRLAFLLIVMASVIAGFEGIEIVKFVILISGEFADRVLYYIEFDPVNINTEIINHLTISHNEEERD